MVLKELIFNNFYIGRVLGGLERTDFLTVSILGGCVVLKELIFKSSTLGGCCGGFKRTDF